MTLLRVTPMVVTALVFLLPAASAQDLELVWADEFDGTSLDLSKWTPQIGTGCPSLCGWGNNELQYYRFENTSVAGGFLRITAKEESFGGRSYTSARIRSLNLGDFRYGRFEMRAQMPIGQGLWPAFWMLPTNSPYGGWAATGEIDIMEYLGHDPDRVSGTLHYGGEFPDNVFSSNAFTLGSGTFHDDFHEFALEWEPCEMRWYVDGQLYATQTNWFSSAAPYPAPFDQPFHLLLNVAVGGNLPGPPDGSTSFPQEMVVDYVRVFQRTDFSACLDEFDNMDHIAPFSNGWFQFNGNVGGGGVGANTTDLPPIDGCRASLESGWGSGGAPGFVGGFGRLNPMDLSTATHFTMWINPDAGQHYTLEINLQDDDNGDNSIPGSPDGADDEFQYVCEISSAGPHAVSGGGWQRLTVPLDAFEDDPTFHFGGNGVFDPVPVSGGGNGQLINVVIAIVSESGADVTFRTDRWAFTRQTASISGRVWNDENSDGTDDAGEPGLADVTVTLFDLVLGQTIASVETAGDGSYDLDALLGALYEVRVDPTDVPAGLDPSGDPDGFGTPHVFATELLCDEFQTARSFGYGPNVVSVPGSAPPAQGLRTAPDPAAARAAIRFELAASASVELAIFDVVGRRVRVLRSGVTPAGPHEVAWNLRDGAGSRVGAGVYYTVLETPFGRDATRITVLD